MVSEVNYYVSYSLVHRRLRIVYCRQRRDGKSVVDTVTGTA